MIGLNYTFFDTYYLICIPAMVFGVSFAINLEDNLKWTKTNYFIRIIRVTIGLMIAYFIDYAFN